MIKIWHFYTPINISYNHQRPVKMPNESSFGNIKNLTNHVSTDYCNMKRKGVNLVDIYMIDAYLRRVIFGEIARYLKHTMGSSQHIPFVNQGSTTII